jgi:ATP phosphoribosyltransferase
MNGTMLIALPKGRLYEKALRLLASAGVVVAEGGSSSRALLLEDTGGRFQFVQLKPVDIPVYVESGAIDAGIVGTDILRELESDVYEPLDLQIGECRMVVAGPHGTSLPYQQNLRVATKYPKTAGRFFLSRNAHIHIVRLEGSVEIAPQLGLAEVIVDLVETGRTLRENSMSILDEVAQVSAKLIVNRTAMKMKAAAVTTLLKDLDRIIYAHT